MKTLEEKLSELASKYEKDVADAIKEYEAGDKLEKLVGRRPDRVSFAASKRPWAMFGKMDKAQALKLFKDTYHICEPMVDVKKGSRTVMPACVLYPNYEGVQPKQTVMAIFRVQTLSLRTETELEWWVREDDGVVKIKVEVENVQYSGPVIERDFYGRIAAKKPNQRLRTLAKDYISWSTGSPESTDFSYLFDADAVANGKLDELLA